MVRPKKWVFFFGPKNPDFGPKIRFFVWDPVFCQRGVCNPRRWLRFGTFGSSLRLFVPELRPGWIIISPEPFRCPSETFPIFAFPKSSSINETSLDKSSWCLLMCLWSIHSRETWTRTGWGLWRPDMRRLSCGRFQRATIVILQMYNISIISWPVIRLFEHSKYTKHPRVLHYVAAHV